MVCISIITFPFPRGVLCGLTSRSRLLLRHSARSRSTTPWTLSRSLSTLVILEQRGGQLSHGYLNAISAAKRIGGTVHGLLAGTDVTLATEIASRAQGVEKILVVTNTKYEKGLPENYAALVASTIQVGNYTHIIAGHTAFGKSLMPRVAALLDKQQISDVMSIKSEDIFERPIYAANAIATIQSLETIKIITIRNSSFSPVEANGGATEIAKGVDPNTETSAEWLTEQLAESDRPDLGTAFRVVSGGRGLKSKENFKNIMIPLAESLRAAVGASRAAVDDGYADNSLQVGQTGKIVAPQLYLAVGISGAIQHLAGMKDSKVIAAINKNPDEPIFQIADIGLVGDLFDKVPELTAKLRKQ